MPLLLTIFIILLFLSNIFLLREGIWFYQDQSFWFKNSHEAFAFLNTQFHAFTNFGYYLGYDQGVLSANNILVYSIYFLINEFFGSSISQIIVSLLGYVIAFFSFWAFSSLFFKDKKVQIILALLYTFNPLMYSFRGQGIIYGAAPLFIFSFYKYYITEKNSSKYLLLNIFALLLWIANVRFLQANIFIIMPYLLLALFKVSRPKLYLKKIIAYAIINLLILTPIIYSLTIPFFQKSPNIFNYGSVFNNFVARGSFYEAFNPFQSINVILYDNRIFTALGIGLFIAVLVLTLKHLKSSSSVFLKINIALLVFGMTLFELGYVVGRDIYPFFIKILPFLTNAPFYGFYIVNIPLLFLIGLIGIKRRKIFYGIAGYFLLVSILPLLQVSNFILQKYSIANIPNSYKTYFVEPFDGIPEATHYVPDPCWRAEYMKDAQTPTLCLNRGLKYVPIEMDNPRAIVGLEALFVNQLKTSTAINNLLITHNLKNIIIAKDIVPAFDAGPLHDVKTVSETKKINEAFSKNNLLALQSNEQFNHYSFKNKKDFDFFIYSPQKVILKENLKDIFDNTLPLSPRPVILPLDAKALVDIPLEQDVKVTFKQSQFDNTKYFVQFENKSMNKPFIIHLTQAYKPGWEIVWIDKKTFENQSCVDEFQTFSLSNNTRCTSKSSLLDIGSLHFLNKKSVSESNHFRGNYLSNTWIVYPKDIPQTAIEQNSTYAVIIYRNQLYLQISILVSVSVLLLVIIYTLMQETKRIFYKKS